MWLLTPSGFLSIVAKGGEGVLTVRSRDMESLEHFTDVLGLDRSEIFSQFPSDYAFRVLSNKDDVATYVASQVANIDYSNFKDEAKRVRGPLFAGFLSKIWNAGWDMTPKNVLDAQNDAWKAEDAKRKAANPHYETGYDWQAVGTHCPCCGRKVRKCQCTDDQLDLFYGLTPFAGVTGMTDAEFEEYEKNS